MAIQIKHRTTGAVLHTVDADTLEHADLRDVNLSYAILYDADLRGADLRNANLRSADLSFASLRGADLSYADLRGANLSFASLYGVNLRDADLYGVNLRNANLHGANIDGEVLTKNPLTIIGLRYWGLITDSYMRLGCKRYTHDEWAAFDDEQIEAMDSGALDFWKQNKTALLALCAAHKPVSSTDKE